MEVNISDLEKILDALQLNEAFHIKRDEMNAAVHSAITARYSPITTVTINAAERLSDILDGIE